MVSQKTSAQLKGQALAIPPERKDKHYIGGKKMFIDNNFSASVETKTNLQRSQIILIRLFQEMQEKNLNSVDNVNRTEVLESAATIGKILDICI